MAYTIDFKGQANAVSATITSNALTVATGDFVTVGVCFADNNDSTAWTVSNTGTAITWTKRAETAVVSNVKVVLWSGTAGATPPGTVSVQSTAGPVLNDSKAMVVIAHTGAHATTPLPAGNIFTGTAGHNASQSITPTSAGSWLWMLAGDWSQTNSFVAGTNCTLAATAYNETGQMTVVPIRPTTQPRTDAGPFAIGETDTAGKISWVAWEVQVALDPIFPGNGGGGYDDRVRVERSTFQGNGTGAAAAMFMSRWPESARDQGYSDQRDDSRSRLN